MISNDLSKRLYILQSDLLASVQRLGEYCNDKHISILAEIVQDQFSNEEQRAVKATLMQELNEHIAEFRSVSFTNLEGGFCSIEGPSLLFIAMMAAQCVLNPIGFAMIALHWIFNDTPDELVSTIYNSS